MFGDPQHYPWTMGAIPNYQTEAHVPAKHILATRPDAKIGVLYQNDSYGKDYLIGLRDGLGVDHIGMVVKEASYEVTDPTVDPGKSSLFRGLEPTRSSSPRLPKLPRKRSARFTTSVGGRLAI